MEAWIGDAITRFGIFWLRLRVLFSQLDLQLAFLNGRLVFRCRCQIFESHGIARLAPESALKLGYRLIVSTFLIEKHPKDVCAKKCFASSAMAPRYSCIASHQSGQDAHRHAQDSAGPADTWNPPEALFEIQKQPRQVFLGEKAPSQRCFG